MYFIALCNIVHFYAMNIESLLKSTTVNMIIDIKTFCNLFWKHFWIDRVLEWASLTIWKFLVLLHRLPQCLRLADIFPATAPTPSPAPISAGNLHLPSWSGPLFHVYEMASREEHMGMSFLGFVEHLWHFSNLLLSLDWHFPTILDLSLCSSFYFLLLMIYNYSLVFAAFISWQTLMIFTSRIREVGSMRMVI